MAVKGAPRSYFKKFKFLIEIDNVASAAFQSCSKLEAEIAKIEQWEGGAVIPNKSPGRVTVSDITLERGATKDMDLFDWFKQVVDIAANSGAVDDEYKRGFDIVVQNRDNAPIIRWRCVGAWPTKFSPGEWDNTEDANLIESTTLTIDSFDLVTE